MLLSLDEVIFGSANHRTIQLHLGILRRRRADVAQLIITHSQSIVNLRSANARAETDSAIAIPMFTERIDFILSLPN